MSVHPSYGHAYYDGRVVRHRYTPFWPIFFSEERDFFTPKSSGVFLSFMCLAGLFFLRARRVALFLIFFLEIIFFFFGRV